jgi:hypothetical protein
MYKSFYIFYAILITQFNVSLCLNIIPDANSNFIYKYKNYFKSDNYNNLINNIIEHKVSKVYIDKQFNELITVDSDTETVTDTKKSYTNELDVIYNYDHYHIDRKSVV